MADPRINRDAVLAAIFSGDHARRVIWTSSTTLAAMEIEWWPHISPHNYQQMKRVLKGLCEEGLLVRRPEKQSRFTLKETAYERGQNATPIRFTPRPA